MTLNLLKRSKPIDGRKWHRDEKYWSFPSSDGTLEKILRVFEGEEIHLDPALQIKLPAPVIARHPEQSEGTPKQSATSTLNQAINALKFYYGTMLKKKFVYEVKRPRKDKKLPVVL